MYKSILLVSALVAGTFVLGLNGNTANAFPAPVIETAKDVQAVTEAGWRRRYWRRYGEWPNGPRADFDTPPIATADDDVVLIAPRRPRSCGEFHYWDGTACVDARFNDPYLGPK